MRGKIIYHNPRHTRIEEIVPISIIILQPIPPPLNLHHTICSLVHHVSYQNLHYPHTSPTQHSHFHSTPTSTHTLHITYHSHHNRSYDYSHTTTHATRATIGHTLRHHTYPINFTCRRSTSFNRRVNSSNTPSIPQRSPDRPYNPDPSSLLPQPFLSTLCLPNIHQLAVAPGSRLDHSYQKI